MKELINISILLCKECDEDATNITQIFDNIKLEGESASFSIVTVVNAIEYTKSRFALHYFIINLDSKKQMYIGSDTFEKENEEENDGTVRGKQRQSLLEDSSQKVSAMRLENIKFLSGGDHEIQVYLYEEDEVDDAEELANNEEYSSLKKKDKLVATYSLYVER